MTKNITIFLTGILLFIGCGSADVKFQKKAGFRKDTGRVVTLSVYNKKEKTFASSEKPFDAFSGLATKEVASIYGSLIPGGAIIEEAAKATGQDAKLKEVIATLFESATEEKDPDSTTAKVFEVIATRLKVDAFAIPITTNGIAAMKEGDEVELSFLLYDARSNKVQYLAKIKDVGVSKLALKAAQDDTQKEGLLTTEITRKSNALMGKVKEELAELNK